MKKLSTLTKASLVAGAVAGIATVSSDQAYAFCGTGANLRSTLMAINSDGRTIANTDDKSGGEGKCGEGKCGESKKDGTSKDEEKAEKH